MKKPSKKVGRKLSLRELILGYVTLIIVMFGFLKFIYLPQDMKLLAESEKISAIHTKIDFNKTMIDGFEARAVASQQEAKKDSSINDYVAASGHLAQVVEHLIAGDKNLVTRMIKLESAKQEKDHKDVSFKIELVGSFPSIGAFIERLENSHILAQVSTVDVASIGSDLDKCVAQIAVNARLFTEDENE